MGLTGKKLLLTLCAGLISLFNQPLTAQKIKATSTVRITFVNVVKDSLVKLNNQQYLNPSNEPFTITKLKYYISNIAFGRNDNHVCFTTQDNFLIDEAIDSSKTITLKIPPGNYTSMFFLLGVDSTKNVSGAQTGALDPLNGMYWTWNSGYVNFKLEGQSPVSTLVNNNFEYHIGGYAGSQNAARRIGFKLFGNSRLQANNDSVSELKLQVDINELWDGRQSVDITNIPACNTPGKLAVSIADNLPKMFRLVDSNN